MRGSAVVVLALVAAGLAGILAFEQGRAGGAELAMLAAPRAAPGPTAPPAPAPAADETAGWVATILARPLFSPDRRAPDEETPSAIAASDDLPRLTGTLVSPTRKTAIFADPARGRPLVIEEGGQIGPYTVQAIEPGQVTVTGPAGPRVLNPAFDPAGVGPSPPPAPPPAAGALPAAAAASPPP